MLGERSRTHKNTYYMIPFIGGSDTDKSKLLEARIMVTSGRMSTGRGIRNFWEGAVKVLYLDLGDYGSILL